MKRLELYGTLGPACAREETLTQMFRAGMTGMRLNLSHGTLRDSRPWLELMRRAAQSCGVVPRLLIDLQGPELRTGASGLPLTLEEGQRIPLSALTLPEQVLAAIRPRQLLLLDDGKLQVRVEEDGNCLVQRGGELLPRKSVALPGLSLHPPTLTPADLQNLRESHGAGVTGVMLPFVRDEQDLSALRRALASCGEEKLQIYAKVENQQGVDAAARWLPLADMLVIARGDLGNAAPLWRLPGTQKRLSALAKQTGKPFMVVTQLLDSMERCAVPTRAEVCDIYNAVLDGASALMLTGETAVGHYPVEAMTYLCRTAAEALRDLESII